MPDSLMGTTRLLTLAYPSSLDESSGPANELEIWAHRQDLPLGVQGSWAMAGLTMTPPVPVGVARDGDEGNITNGGGWEYN